MATRKQVVEAIDQWLHETESEDLEDKDLDIDDELEFFLHEYLNEYGLCESCRCYFSPDRTCEKIGDSIRCCMNRMYAHWREHHNKGENNKGKE